MTDSPACPHCGETRLVERIGKVWFCQVCGKDWPGDVGWHDWLAVG